MVVFGKNFDLVDGKKIGKIAVLFLELRKKNNKKQLTVGIFLYEPPVIDKIVLFTF